MPIQQNNGEFRTASKETIGQKWFAFNQTAPTNSNCFFLGISKLAYAFSDDVEMLASGMLTPQIGPRHLNGVKGTQQDLDKILFYWILAEGFGKLLAPEVKPTLTMMKQSFANPATKTTVEVVDQTTTQTLAQTVEDIPANRAFQSVFEIEKTVEGYTISNLKLGTEIHKAYKAGLKGKEFRLPSGRKIDYLDIENGIINELKPNNPRQIKKGLKQLEIYKKELETLPQFKNINWKTNLDLY